MIDFIITGCGRSSTQYTAEVLTAAGLPCGHETVCSSWTDEYGDDGLWRTETGGESSWQAAPFAGAMQAEGVKVIHLIRHPAEVASSLIANEMLCLDSPEASPKPWHNFATTYIGDRFWRLHPHDRALWFWTEWNLLISAADLHWTAPINESDIHNLALLLGRRADLSALASISKQVNHRREVERLQQKDFTPVIWDEAMDLWRSYF